jgi:hypothetical protein
MERRVVLTADGLVCPPRNCSASRTWCIGTHGVLSSLAVERAREHRCRRRPNPKHCSAPPIVQLDVPSNDNAITHRPNRLARMSMVCLADSVLCIERRASRYPFLSQDILHEPLGFFFRASDLTKNRVIVSCAPAQAWMFLPVPRAPTGMDAEALLVKRFRLR